LNCTVIGSPSGLTFGGLPLPAGWPALSLYRTPQDRQDPGDHIRQPLPEGGVHVLTALCHHDPALEYQRLQLHPADPADHAAVETALEVVLDVCLELQATAFGEGAVAQRYLRRPSGAASEQDLEPERLHELKFIHCWPPR
jgi:hypothetical protein